MIDWEERLGRDERLLWTGAPEPGFKFKLVDVPAVAFGLLFAGIGGMIALENLPFGFLIPHFWVGLYVAFGRFVVDRIVRSSTSYAVTDQRAIVVRTWPTRKTTSLPLALLSKIELTEHRDGSGTIRLHSHQDEDLPKRPPFGSFSPRQGPAFEYVVRPHEVMALLRLPPPPDAAVPRSLDDPPWPVTYGTPPAPFDPTGATRFPPPPVTGALPPAPHTRPVPVEAPPAPVPSRASTATPDPTPAEARAHGPFWRPSA